jgi:hypothetical protein
LRPQAGRFFPQKKRASRDPSNASKIGIAAYLIIKKTFELLCPQDCFAYPQDCFAGKPKYKIQVYIMSGTL